MSELKQIQCDVIEAQERQVDEEGNCVKTWWASVNVSQISD
jgi:hypothetical protein